jgi:hypothetical protein
MKDKRQAGEGKGKQMPGEERWWARKIAAASKDGHCWTPSLGFSS